MPPDRSMRPSPAGPPTCNTGATFYGWDWTATTHDGRAAVVNDLLDALGGAVALPGKGLQGWSQSVGSYDAEGYLLGRVFFGGGRDDVHVLSTSAAADQVRPRIAGMDRARTARVDTRVDTLVPWDALIAEVEASADPRAQFMFIHGRKNGQASGRTVYVGAPSSRIRVRVYEKWLESPGQYVEGTNRVEVQLRPHSAVKADVSGWSSAETFCASAMTRHLAQRLGDDLAPVASLRLNRGTPDLERTLRVMGEQYGPSVERWLKVSGGDMGTVLDRLLDKGGDDSADGMRGRPSSPDLWARVLNTPTPC